MSVSDKIIKTGQLSTDGTERTNESPQPLMGFPLYLRLSDTINLGLVKIVMRQVQRDNLEGKTWEDLDPKTTCITISSEIRADVKHICESIREDHRYKFVIQTCISRFNKQSVTLKTRGVWDSKTDRLVYENYVNEHIICSSLVIFVYYY